MIFLFKLQLFNVSYVESKSATLGRKVSPSTS